ncbi:MAG: transglutaminase family protein [Balneolaceae bacterium]|nr:transglutaminase family protein [Balneolaceae bacterium]
MELQIIHKTTYSYTKPVKLDPHYLHFKPLYRPYLTVREFDLRITPNPTNIFERLDAENNPYHQVYLPGTAVKELSIQVTMQITTQTYNPFEFLLDPRVKPRQDEAFYPNSRSNFLGNYLNHWSYPCLQEFVEELIDRSENTMVPFLSAAIRRIHSEWRQVFRTQQDRLNASRCFEEKEGSCRDLAWMLINMLRSIGLATRFVSGYAFNPQLDVGHELHAWVEVLLPGAGWIGLDPSSGLFANEYYLPVATSFSPNLTMPVDGTYRGKAKSNLDTSVEISIEQ